MKSMMLGAMVFLISCGSKNNSETKVITGKDDRIRLTAPGNPWSAIGKLSTRCTGTLVHPKLVLTASHCVYDAYQRLKSRQIYFYPKYTRGSSLGSGRAVRVWAGTKHWNTYPGRDWALLELDRSMSSRAGWVPITSQNFLGQEYISIVGYSQSFYGGQYAGLHQRCQVRENDGRFLKHDCDVSPGFSGGPVLVYDQASGGYSIAGINVRGDTIRLPTYNPRKANRAISSQAFSFTAQRVIDMLQ